MATKSSPLTLEELLQAQQQMLRRSDLSDSQRKTAEQQIEKLEQIRNSLTIANAQRLKEDIDLGKITDPRGDSSHVTLGDVREELRNLTAEGGTPRPGRPQLPRMLRPRDDQIMDVPAQEVPDQPGDTREAQLERLKKIGSVIERKTELQRGGARNEGLNVRNTQAFDRFIAETEKRDTILADANAEQIKIFERIEETLLKLREANSTDSKRLREELAGLSGELSQTGDTVAKQKIGSVLSNTQRAASASNRGNTGSLGDALQAAMGKRSVLREGVTYDERTQRYHEFDAESGKVGKMVKAKDAKLGRLAGAASILGGFIGNKAEEFVESQRSEKVQGFLDNFRSTESGTRGEQLASLQGQQRQLEQSPQAAVRPQKTAPKMVHHLGPKMVIASQQAAGAAVRGGSNRLSAQTLNITGQVIQLKAGKVEMTGGEAGPRLYEDSGSRAGEKFKAEPAATAQPAASEGAGLGLGLGDALDLGKRGISKAGGILKSAGTGAWNVGKSALGKGAGLVKNLSPAVKMGGAAALLGLGASYAGDKLKEAGHEKTGSALDVAGTAASWGGTGAMIGSVVPGVGTAIGAGVGAVAGGAYGLYKNWGGLFGKKEQDAAAQPTTPMAGPKTLDQLAQEQAKMYGGKPSDPANQQAARMEYRKQLMGGKGEGELKGVTYDTKKDFPNQSQPAAADSVQPAPTPAGKSGAEIGNRSAANAQARTPDNKPVVITNNNVAPSTGGQTQTFARRGGVRPEESAMERYANRNAHFF